ncbi:hypothetical protein [Streptomyces sp. ACT015]|uniref:hypothetical protein n=1 Tax=Streptomyces sp. ACT015 TaxID=3134807 RepID=UPI003D178B7C
MTIAQSGRGDLPSPARAPRLAILRPDRDLLRLLDADHTKKRSYSQPCREWPEAKPHLAILLTPIDQRGDENGGEQPERIWGLGIVRPAHETDRDRKVVVTRARSIQGAAPVSGLWCADAGLAKSLPESGPVTVGAHTVFDNLRRISSEVEVEIQRLMPSLDDAAGWSERELRWRDERDALLLFAKIAGLAANDFSAVRLWEKPVTGAAFVGGLIGTEVQPTLDDVRGWAAARFSGIGETVVRTFASRGGSRSYDFEATSITDQSVVDGRRCSLDAYYYHVATRTLVVLRYLCPGSEGLLLPEDWRSLVEFHSRVQGLPRSVRRSADDYSLLDDALFLRIHEPVPFAAALHRTSSGAIYPYDQVTAATAALAGPNLPALSMGSLTRHLVPTHFAQLVRDGWFGASGVPFEGALNCVEGTISTVGAALLVVDFSLRQRGNGSGIQTWA